MKLQKDKLSQTNDQMQVGQKVIEAIRAKSDQPMGESLESVKKRVSELRLSVKTCDQDKIALREA